MSEPERAVIASNEDATREPEHGDKGPLCGYCDKHMTWCSQCRQWSSTCCVEYGTCQCS